MPLSPLIWISIGFIIMGLEIVVPGFVLFWFGAGALLTALFVVLGLLPNAELQWGFFFVSSLLFLAGWHLYFKKHFRRVIVDEDRDPTIRDLKGRVTKEILKDIPGEVELYSPFHGIKKWQAESDVTIMVGEEVVVKESRGIKLVVNKR